MEPWPFLIPRPGSEAPLEVVRTSPAQALYTTRRRCFGSGYRATASDVPDEARDTPDNERDKKV